MVDGMHENEANEQEVQDETERRRGESNHRSTSEKGKSKVGILQQIRQALYFNV